MDSLASIRSRPGTRVGSSLRRRSWKPEQEADITFTYHRYLPEGLARDLVGDIHEIAPVVRVRPQPPALNGCLDALIPGAITVVIANAYFQSFLKEAGKDHYHILKQWLMRVASRSRALETRSVGSVDADALSRQISIYFPLKNDLEIKLTLNYSVDEDAWAEAVGEFADLIHEHYSSYPHDQLTATLMSIPHGHGERFYALLDPERNAWVLYTSRMIIGGHAS